jgi:hypothetical protein
MTSGFWISQFKIADWRICPDPLLLLPHVQREMYTLQGDLDADIPAGSDKCLECGQGIPQVGIHLDVERRRNQESAANTWTKKSVSLYIKLITFKSTKWLQYSLSHCSMEGLVTKLYCVE